MQAFEAWDLAIPPLPARTRLYSLRPIGVGTAEVESLTGYVARLAEAHSLSVGDLLVWELTAHSSSPLVRVYARKKLSRRHTPGPSFERAAYSLNGMTSSSQTWISALEAATGQSNLQSLTLAPLKAAVAEGTLFRKARAWCPVCYRAWRSCGTPLYEPLLWSFRRTVVCPQHECFLQEHCPHCRYRSRPLATFLRPGYCSNCQSSLAYFVETTPFEGHFAEEAAGIRFAGALGDLLAAQPRLAGLNLGVAFRQNLLRLAARFAQGNLHALADSIGISYGVFYAWARGLNRVTIDSLLLLSERIGVAPSTLLTPDANLECCAPLRCRGKPFHDSAVVRVALQEALTETPPPALSTVAKRLGYRSVDWLYKVDYACCRRIAKNYRESMQCAWTKTGAQPLCSRDQMKRALESSLVMETPTPIDLLATNLGYAIGGTILRHNFPDLCKAISAKRMRRKAARDEHIRQIADKALLEQPPPTLKEIATRAEVTGRQTLCKHYPGLASRHAEKRKAYRTSRAKYRRELLEKALAETPPSPFSSLARQLNLSRGALERASLELCRAIAARYRRYRMVCHAD